jgi:hypothetical protein
VDVIDTKAIVAAVASHAAASGHCERVNGHEPASNPGPGITAAVWCDSVSPVPAGSGLASTTAVLVLMVRLYMPVQTEPQDMIDPAMMDAVDALMAAYSSDFELGGLIRNIDLQGQTGTRLAARAGYLEYPDGPKYRVYTITVPCIVNDAWTQAA